MSSNPPIPQGYSDIPRGKIVNAVTCLEMFTKPDSGIRRVEAPSGLHVSNWSKPVLDDYRALYCAVGTDWLWASRLMWSDETLMATLHDPLVEVHALMSGERAVGLLELDFRAEAECELAYFGIIPDAIGTGAGRFLMHHAIELAWRRPIKRFWLHTCHFDHPAALGFYRRSGFRPYKMMVEVMDDPRLLDVLPLSAAPHVPLIEGE